MWKGTVVLISVLAVTSAFQAVGQLEPKPDKFKNQEGCYMSEFDKVVPFGKSETGENCVQYSCGETNILISGCGSIHVDPPHELVEDKSKPYPDCCPKLKD